MRSLGRQVSGSRDLPTKSGVQSDEQVTARGKGISDRFT